MKWNNAVSELIAKECKCFEDIKHIRPERGEYWSVREIAIFLDFTVWRNFKKVIDKAMIDCNNSGHSVFRNFAVACESVGVGTASKPVKDYELSRNAFYLISIHERKGLAAQDNLLDFMDSAELITNLFRICRLRKNLSATVGANANAAHHSVGREVRGAIERVGGKMPEDLPTLDKSIMQIEKEQLAELKMRAKKKPLILDD
jgi:hypothetical protein